MDNNVYLVLGFIAFVALAAWLDPVPRRVAREIEQARKAARDAQDAT